ncbi:MAG: HAMP domain-containing histidine kinase [Sphingomonas sp.]|uniref:HAMP domain-containing sensor histidine kinase n=1 Tax=Sphingomonas sp. TaxID=28214 RepID=UPI0025DFA5DD|nr:HAMP domain-containing sensor histidine kinase [Sphingomonas sp.]MBY0284651.1 HAMP domain-containing histidine kinase [Sphingomonas sp.]
MPHRKKLKWYASAAYRIALIYSVVYAVTIAALGMAVYFAADAEISRQQDEGIRVEIVELADEYRREGLDDLVRAINAREAGGGSNSFSYGLFDARGKRMAGTLQIRAPAIGWHRIAVRERDDASVPARLFSTDIAPGLRLAVALDNHAIEQVDRTILALCLAAFALAIVVGAIGALMLGGYLQRRFEVVVATAVDIAGGNLGRRMPLGPRGDEFDRLGGALNAMLDRITMLLDNLRQISSDVAHDLRTPLARLRVEIELAQNGAPDPEQQRAALDRALRQSDELLRLFSAILRISEVEGGALERSFSTINVSALVEDLSESFAPAITDGGRTLTQSVVPGLSVRGDRELIAQALINLLDNAQRHTPPGTAIAILAERVSDGVQLIVADNGPGVPEADRERVVRRFVRLDSSRTNAGHGLGLNLVSAIAVAHGGRLVIGDNAPGLRVTLWLPTAS